jgi:peroxiredoxin family protein
MADKPDVSKMTDDQHDEYMEKLEANISYLAEDALGEVVNVYVCDGAEDLMEKMQDDLIQFLEQRGYDEECISLPHP